MRRAAVLLLTSLALAGCGGDEAAAPDAAAPSDGVEELANVLDLRADFDGDTGTTRVILLLSPT